MRRPIDVGIGGVSYGQMFGQDPATYAQFGMKGHNGADYPAPTGRPVYAPENGQVIISGNNVRDQYTGNPVDGETIAIRGNSYEHWLLHLSQRLVNAGQQVTEGQLVGYSGNTGFTTGPHLHWGTRPLSPNLNNGYRGFIDPTIVLNTPAPQPAPTNAQGAIEMINTADEAVKAYKLLRPNYTPNQAEINITAGKRSWLQFVNDGQREREQRDAALLSQSQALAAAQNEATNLRNTITQIQQVNEQNAADKDAQLAKLGGQLDDTTNDLQKALLEVQRLNDTVCKVPEQQPVEPNWLTKILAFFAKV